MSLHIESTENALAELKKQRTKTLTAAISVSFLGIALMGLLLYLVHIIVAVPEDPPMVAYATQEGDNPDIDTPEVTQTTQRPSSFLHLRAGEGHRRRRHGGRRGGQPGY